MLKLNEKWIDCFNERYAVSTTGDVVSYKDGRELLKQYELKSRKVDVKRLVVALYDATNKKQVHAYVSNLVAKAFLEMPHPFNHIVVHKDENRLNCDADNLVWVDKKEAVKGPQGAGLRARHARLAEASATQEEILYVMDGVGERLKYPYLIDRVLREASDSDFMDRGIPLEYREGVVSLTDGSVRKTWDLHKRVFEAADSKCSLKKAALMAGVDQSYISMVRNGKRLVAQKAIYDKYIANKSVDK